MTQEKALEILKSGANVFLTGEPGAGKTYTIEQFAKHLEKEKIRYALTASTGIAASHINGSTIHSWSGLGVRRFLVEEDFKMMRNNQYNIARISSTKVLIIDEISMLDAQTLDNVDAIMRAMTGKVSLPFGGVQVVFVGDFFQLPPVSKDNTARFAFEADSWEMADLRVCYLTEQHRQSDQEFLDILSAMRSGTLTDSQKKIIEHSHLEEVPETKLYTHNADVDILNYDELSKLPGDAKIYTMAVGGNPKLIPGLKQRCISPELLVLKEGALVMATANNFEEGFVNGSIGHVESLKSDPVVRFLNGKVVELEQFQWSHMDDRHTKVLAHISQYPLRLAWAITVHKSQGMSLDSACIDLSKTFEYGQGYVAISRVRTLDGLHITGINDMAFKMHPQVVEKDAYFRQQGI